MRWTNSDYEIDDDRSRLDMDRIVCWLAESYWARNTPESAVRRSWEKAGVMLGLYKDAELIGCARAVTDFARFAYLSDVFVEPGHRGHGLGRWLVQTMIEHPDILGVRWVLHTDDAHGLYSQLGFEAPDETVMQRPRPVASLLPKG
jgi:GNAT superfamily N-acetyltransferase